MTRSPGRIGLALLLAGLVGACSADPPADEGLGAAAAARSSSRAHRGVVPPLAEASRRADPDGVAAAALTTLFSYDTARDARPADAALRAMQWFSPGYWSAVQATSPVGNPGNAWSTWTSHRAIVTATVAPAGDDRPADSATGAQRQLTVEQHPRGRDGWTAPSLRSTAFVVLVRVDGGWAVDNVLIR